MVAAITVANTLVNSTFDYCNSIYCGLTKGKLRKLELIQNALADVVTGANKWTCDDRNHGHFFGEGVYHAITTMTLYLPISLTFSLL